MAEKPAASKTHTLTFMGTAAGCGVPSLLLRLPRVHRGAGEPRACARRLRHHDPRRRRRGGARAHADRGHAARRASSAFTRGHPPR